jgi:hypothetical protein
MTPEDVARWMLEELKREKYLYQETVVYDIESKFGEKFTYVNENGNLSIDRRVLREFRKLTEDIVVWERRERLWRFRENYDESGRRQE